MRLVVVFGQARLRWLLVAVGSGFFCSSILGGSLSSWCFGFLGSNSLQSLNRRCINKFD